MTAKTTPEKPRQNKRPQRKSPLEIPLDNNASSVIIALSNSDGPEMAHEYEVEYKGATIHCKTLNDLLDLLQGLGQDSKHAELQPLPVHDFVEFVNHVQLNQRRLLHYLLERPREKPLATDADIRQHFDIKNNQALAGWWSGISKVALSLDIDPQRVYQQKTSYLHGKPIRWYWITNAFRQAALDNDWPSERDLADREEEEYRRQVEQSAFLVEEEKGVHDKGKPRGHHQ